MTSKYVPPSMRGDTLVNTSLPAKEAPRLTPATLASITSTSSSVTGITSTLSSLRLEKKLAPLSKVQLTDDDFPALGAKKPVKAITQGTNYAALSREWAKKQEEDAVAAKDAAEKEKNRIQV